MFKNKLIQLLKNGEYLYVNYDSDSLISYFISPGTKDEYTHYLYFDHKTELIYEYEKKTQKSHHVSVHHVQHILESLEREQTEVNNFLNRTNNTSIKNKPIKS